MATEIAKIDCGEDVINELLERLEDGQSLSTICADKRMPHRRTIERWANADDALAADIARARQIGYQARAERAVVMAQTAEDAAKGRLAFDAERWYLGKLSNAFSDDKKRELKVEHSLSPEAAKWLGVS